MLGLFQVTDSYLGNWFSEQVLGKRILSYLKRSSKIDKEFRIEKNIKIM